MEETNKSTTELSEDDAPRLLAAIRSNPETAHILAEIALGGDPAELLSGLASEKTQPEPAPEPKPEPAPEALAPSRPAFLGYVRESFWN